MKNEMKDENKQEKLFESIDAHKCLNAVKANSINSLNLGQKSFSNCKKHTQPDKGNMIIFFSSKAKESVILDSHSKVDDQVSFPKK